MVLSEREETQSATIHTHHGGPLELNASVGDESTSLCSAEVHELQHPPWDRRVPE